ncbi:Amidase enhancer precursor [compost metagenome]
MKKKSNRVLRACAGMLAALLIWSCVPAYKTQAAENEDIRVALFVNAGSSYKSTVPVVTMQGDGGFGLGTAGAPWMQVGSGETARFSIDSFKVKAMQSTDWSTIVSAVKKLQATSDKPVAYVMNTSQGRLYQIYTGPYASKAEATTAATRVSSTISGQLAGQKPIVKGSYYYEAGSFSTSDQAEDLRSKLLDGGVDAYIAMKDIHSFAVWAGGETDAAVLAQIKGQVEGAGGNTGLVNPDQVGFALITHQDVTLNLSTPSALPHYALYGNNAVLSILNSSNQPIQVVERSNRKYRGNFEISTLNGQLALVNELPMEQYLYSVVAAEVPSSWPAESLKAQAVAARSFAKYNAKLNKFKVAGLVDTTLSQVYNGTEKEVASVIAAVDATAGEAIYYNGKVVEGIFSSNSGGVSADSIEAWGNADPIYASVPSAEDKVSQASLKSWYYIQMSNGVSGYVREDNVALTGSSNSAGLPILKATSNGVNVRPLPLIQSGVAASATLSNGEQAVVLSKVSESNTYDWVRGPFTSAELVKSLTGKLTTAVPASFSNLEVSKRGPSGRVIELTADGQDLKIRYPDSWRSALGGLPSTLFDIVPTGRYTVQGAFNNTATNSVSGTTTVMTSSGAKQVSGNNLVVMGADQKARVVDKSNRFVFVGRGYGHGIGMSQWGAKGMADAGFDYVQILQHYYQNVTISESNS